MDKPEREYRVAAHHEGYVVQSRTVASNGWIDGPIFLSQEKAEAAMHRLVAWNEQMSVTTRTAAS
jgi:single-stranded DNA-binding protein